MTVFLTILVCCVHGSLWTVTRTQPWTQATDVADSTSERIDSLHSDAELTNDNGSYFANSSPQPVSAINWAPKIDDPHVIILEPDNADINEDSIDVLYPDWVLQTRTFDPSTDKTTVTVVKRDGGEIVRNVESNDGIDWANKTRTVDPQNHRATLTVFDNDGSWLILELDTRTDRVKETWRDHYGTTTIRQVDPVTVNESGIQQNSAKGLEPTNTSGRDRFELKIITRPDGSTEFWRTNLKTRHANGTLFFSNGTQKIVRTHPKFGFKNVTLIFPDGRQEIRGFNATNGAEVLELLFPNGTSMSQVIDDRIAESLVDLLDPLWTRKVREGDPETGIVTLTIYSSDGTHTTRRVKRPCKKYRHDDCKRTEIIREIDPITGHKSVNRLGSPQPRKSSSNFNTNSHNFEAKLLDSFKRMSLFNKHRPCQPGFFMYRGSRCRRKIDLFGTY